MKNRTILFFTVASLGTLQAQDITTPYYIHNQGETGYMTQLSDVATKYTLKLRSHAANGTSFYFGQGNLGATQLLQSANSNGATAYTLSLNPFGGKVGVGTVAPISMLDVNGNATFREDVEIGSNNATNGNLKLELYAGKRLVTDGVSEIVQRAASVSGSSWGSARIVTSAPSNGTSIWKLQTSINNILGDRLTIGSDGNASFAGSVGIGTVSPQRKLSIIDGTNNAKLRLGYDDDFYMDYGNNSISMNRISNSQGVLTIETQGSYASSGGHIVLKPVSGRNVGIGTTTPSRKLEVLTIDSWNIPPLRIGSDDGYEPAVDFKSGAGAFSIAVNNGANNAFTIYHNAPSNSMVINNGNIGIGTISPSRRLEVLTTDSWNFPPLRIGSDDGYEPTVDFKSGTAAFSIAVNNGANNAFVIYHNAPSNSMVINNGNVGIGTTAPGTYKLAVEGKIGARSVKVTTANWADYVFAPTYNLMSLPETEAYIKENQHLPDIPSAAEVKANGFHLEEMDAKLLAKIEELTLHAIEQDKKAEQQNTRIIKLEKEIKMLTDKIKTP